MQFDERKEGIDPLTYSTYYSVCFCGNCARMIAANMMTHPRISLVLSCCLRMIHPARTEMQDSRLSIRMLQLVHVFLTDNLQGVSYSA